MSNAQTWWELQQWEVWQDYNRCRNGRRKPVRYWKSPYFSQVLHKPLLCEDSKLTWLNHCSQYHTICWIPASYFVSLKTTHQNNISLDWANLKSIILHTNARCIAKLPDYLRQFLRKQHLPDPFEQLTCMFNLLPLLFHHDISIWSLQQDFYPISLQKLTLLAIFRSLYLLTYFSPRRTRCNFNLDKALHSFCALHHTGLG